jgi:hypothetical protein
MPYFKNFDDLNEAVQESPNTTLFRVAYMDTWTYVGVAVRKDRVWNMKYGTPTSRKRNEIMKNGEEFAKLIGNLLGTGYFDDWKSESIRAKNSRSEKGERYGGHFHCDRELRLPVYRLLLDAFNKTVKHFKLPVGVAYHIDYISFRAQDNENKKLLKDNGFKTGYYNVPETFKFYGTLDENKERLDFFFDAVKEELPNSNVPKTLHQLAVEKKLDWKFVEKYLTPDLKARTDTNLAGMGF